MDEAKLAEIEARANAIHAEMTHTRTRCRHCDAVNPPTDDRGCHDECPSQGDNARLWHAMVTRDGTKLEGVAGLCEIAGHMTDLVAEVRRLTAALATATTPHAAALDAARREGAEGMRERLAAIWDARAAEHDATADRFRASREMDLAVDYERWAQRDRAEAAAIRALPLGAPGGAS